MWVDVHQQLENDRVRLEPLAWKHFEFLLPICLAHPDLLQYSPPAFGSEEALKKYFENNLRLQSAGTKSPWVIYGKLSQQYKGSTSYLNISEKDKRLEIGSTWLDPATHRTGLNRACKFLLLQNAFEKLEAERVEFKTDKRNLQSQKAILALGASYEGTLRRHTTMSDGYRRDTLYYSILKAEWADIKENVFSNES